MHMVLFLWVSCMYLHVVTIASYQIHSADGDGKYGIILDGGSTGTKLKIYKWRKKLSVLQKPVLELELVDSTKFKPSISAYASRLDEVAVYLNEIITRALTIVPSHERSRTPIYFMATAGLRVLSESTTVALLETIETFLDETPFLTQGDNTRVLSGEEEGVYAWIAANYLRGFFWSNKPVSQSVGVLEMGGGSTQIAFIPDTPIYANMFPVRIGGQRYHLYAHSYLFYGQNYIISRINKYLIQNNVESSQLENPCMLIGDNTTMSTSQGSVHIVGSANTYKCLEILEVFLRTAEDSWCYPKPCAIGRTYQPAVGNTLFYAISAFVYAPTYLKAVDKQGRLNISLLLENAEIFCSKTLEDITSSGLSAEFASSYCTMGLYIPSLLVDAYRFEISSQTIHVASKVNNTNIDWALGAMLLQLDNNMDLLANCDTSAGFTVHHVTLSYAVFTTAIYILVKALFSV